MENNGTPFFKFEDLRIYEKTISFTAWLYEKVEATPNFPVSLQNRFTENIEKVAFHIAEGSTQSKSNFINHLKTAKSLVRSCIVNIAVLEKLKILSEEDSSYAKGVMIELTKMLGAFVSSLYRGQKLQESHDSDSSDQSNSYSEFSNENQETTFNF